MAWNDQLVATTLDNYISNTLADNVSSQIALYSFLQNKDKVTVDGGLTIREPLMYALNNTVGSYSGYDTIDITPQTGIGYAEYPWRNVAGSVTISFDDELKNTGTPAVLKLLQAKLDQLELSFTEKLNQMWFGDGTGNASKDFLGLQALINNSGIVGGIDSSTETWWRSVVDSNLNIATNINELNTLFNSVVRGADRPDFEITTQAGYEKYETLASPNIRFQSTQLAQLGFDSLAHKSAEIVFDAYCPSGNWFVLNSRHLKLVQHSEAWMKRFDFVRPANQLARTALVVSVGNLITNNRRMHARATALTLA
jgi:hypothetical protein